MMRRTMLAMAVALVLVLGIGGTALAASPQDIYNDYADNAKLDGTYTIAEIEAYLNDATVNQYGSAAVLTPLNALATKVLGAMKAGDTFAVALAKALGTTPSDDDRSEFPFTGMELLIIALGAVVLIGGGLTLRRASR
ncbi:MAG: hypothetical protein ACYC33_07465 [Thermoleophilia bacterium]